MPIEMRFWDKVDKTDPQGCWIWTGATIPTGYGQVRGAGMNHRAHRVAYELVIGPIPDGLELDHLCSNRGCVNPDHLEPVRHAENIRRGRGGANSAARTHCPQSHPYDEANTYLYQGRRFCRACLGDC